MVFRAAQPAQLDTLVALLERTRAALIAAGILQWDERYPSRAFLAEALADRTLFVLTVNHATVGMAVLDEWQSPEWAAIVWQHTDRPALVLHALMVDPERQGQGYGAALVAQCERYAAAQGYRSVRIDVFTGNPAALRLYERLGYRYRGDVRFEHKPAGHERYACYEKALDG